MAPNTIKSDVGGNRVNTGRLNALAEAEQEKIEAGGQVVSKGVSRVKTGFKAKIAAVFGGMALVSALGGVLGANNKNPENGNNKPAPGNVDRGIGGEGNLNQGLVPPPVNPMVAPIDSATPAEVASPTEGVTRELRYSEIEGRDMFTIGFIRPNGQRFSGGGVRFVRGYQNECYLVFCRRLYVVEDFVFPENSITPSFEDLEKLFIKYSQVCDPSELVHAIRKSLKLKWSQGFRLYCDFVAGNDLVGNR